MMYATLINIFMLTMIGIGLVQQRWDLVVGGITAGLVGLLCIFVHGRIEFGSWTWWKQRDF